MILRRRTEVVNEARLLAASAGLLGTSIPIALNRLWPIEEIHITLGVTAGAIGPTFASATTNAVVDNILSLLKQVKLDVLDGDEPRTVLKASGAGLLEYASQAGLNLSRATLGAVALSQGSSIANNLKFRIHYRIPLVHPMIGEPLRTRMLLPVHTYAQDPILTLDFANTADFASAGTIAALLVEVRLIRRMMPDAVTQGILNSGGFIPFDLLETNFPVSSNASGEIYFDIPLSGQYMNLLLRQYLGGASITRDVLDQTTTLGSETKWDIQSGQVVLEAFRWRSLQDMNDLSRPANIDTQASSPNFAGAVASGTRYQPASSCMLDFLSDGLESADELGSLLDCNIPANSGLKMQLHGFVTAQGGFTYPSTLYMMGHRLFGSLAKWQAVNV